MLEVALWSLTLAFASFSWEVYKLVSHALCWSSKSDTHLERPVYTVLAIIHYFPSFLILQWIYTSWQLNRFRSQSKVDRRLKRLTETYKKKLKMLESFGIALNLGLPEVVSRKYFPFFFLPLKIDHPMRRK